MQQHILTNENALKKHLESLSCKGCKYFPDNKCIHVKKEQNEKDKPFLVEHALKRADAFSVDWAKNIDNHFICDNYERKTNK